MEMTGDVKGEAKEQKKTPISQLKGFESQEEWISEEELYTEGSSDEDDMALRMKRQEHRQGKRAKSTGSTSQVSPIVNSEYSLATEESEEELHNISDTSKQGLDDPNKWRPTQGTFKLRNISDAEGKHSIKSRESYTVDRYCQ